jgi:dTMP kinase
MSQPKKPNDNARDLLAGILDDTASAASGEEQRRLQAREAQQRAQLQAQAQEDARKRAEAERALREEQERQQQAKMKRTNMIRAIEGPSQEEIEAMQRAELESRKRVELEARLQEAERARMEAERKAAEAARASRQQEQQRLEALARPVAASPRRGGAGLALGIAAAAMFVAVVLTAAGGVALYASKTQPSASQTWGKALYKPSEARGEVVTAGFLAIPKPDLAGEAEPDKPNAKGATGRPKVAQPRKDPKDGKPKFNFSDDGDVFDPRKQ